MTQERKRNSPGDLEGSLIATLAESDLSGIATDLCEVSIDVLLEDGVLKDIPIVGLLAKTYDAIRTISNRLFTKKVLGFLVHIQEVPIVQRKKQIAKLTVDSKYQQHVGENLLLLIDRLNDMSKPTLLSLAFKAYLEGRIDYPLFQRLAHALDALQMSCVDTLKSIYSDDNPTARMRRLGGVTLKPDPELQHLAFCGLLSFTWRELDSLELDRQNPFGGYAPNELGKVFCDLLFFRKEDVPA
jgi:hypothetical protein